MRAIVCSPVSSIVEVQSRDSEVLVDNNFVENDYLVGSYLFTHFDSVNILVFQSTSRKQRRSLSTPAVKIFKKVTNNNILEDKHIAHIMEIFDRKDDVENIAKSVDNNKIAENDYNLSVSSYVEAKDTREKIDIKKLNAEITETVERINVLRADIDEIIKEIEG